MIEDYAPTPVRYLVSDGQFVGDTPRDRAATAVKLWAAYCSVVDKPKQEPPAGALRHDPPKLIGAPRPAVQPQPVRVREPRPKSPTGRNGRGDRRDVPVGTVFGTWTVIKELEPYITKENKAQRMFTCEHTCKRTKRLKLSDMAKRIFCVCLRKKSGDGIVG